MAFFILLLPLSLAGQQEMSSLSGSTGNILFLENKGQWPQEVAYNIKHNAGTIFLEKDRFTFLLTDPAAIDHFNHRHDHSDMPEDRKSQDLLNVHAYEMVFENISPHVNISATGTSDAYYNYFIGNDPANWASYVRGYKQVRYSQIYPGIDIEVKQEGKHLKWDYILAAGADPSLIKVKYNGADKVELRDGKLFITTTVNTAIEYIPEAYQFVDGVKKIIPCEYILSEGNVSFHFPEGYDNASELVIDPVLTFASYSGSTADNFGFTATYDTLGNLYGGGIVFNLGYPVTTGAFATTFSGNIDIGITKFNSSGNSLIYSTFIGGLDAETPHSLIVNKDLELVILGATSSVTFPVTINAFDNTFNGGNSLFYPSNGTSFNNGTDIIITVLDAAGAALVGSTYLGGSGNDGLNEELISNYGDQFRGEVVVDNVKNIYIASSTKSTNFPTTTGAVKTGLTGSQDAVVSKFNSDLSSLLMSTYLGGIGTDAAYSLKLDQNNNMYIVGGTTSSDFPATPNAVNPSLIGNTDGYITHLESNGVAIIASSFVGTSFNDQTYFVEIDQSGKVYVVGQTWGSYPVTAGVYSNANSGQYITKFEPGLNSIIFSTVFGKGDGNPELSPTAFLVDNCENIYVSGWGGNTNTGVGFPDPNISQMPLTNDAFQSTTDGSDFYFIVLAKDAQSLKYASYFGGDISSEHVDGGTSRFDKAGIIYQAVCAGCGGNDDFPTTTGAWSNTNNSSNCNLGVVKFEFQLNQVVADAVAIPSTEGCAPLEVNFQNTGTIGLSYHWDFDNGQTTNQQNPTFEFVTPGTYEVMLIVTDTSECFTSDTAYITVNVFAEAVAGFTASPDFILEGGTVSFNNTSTNATDWFWTFGDGATSTEKDPQHSYNTKGTYEVCLTANNIKDCPDTTCKTVVIEEVAIIDIPTAFSPNGDGQNDILFVKGSGISEVRLRIYNRWGQLLFETNDLSRGWDGTYKGAPQEMEVYMYTLDAVLNTGQNFFKQGNITLIR